MSEPKQKPERTPENKALAYENKQAPVKKPRGRPKKKPQEKAT
jgi:hypothetical protein